MEQIICIKMDLALNNNDTPPQKKTNKQTISHKLINDSWPVELNQFDAFYFFCVFIVKATYNVDR